MTEQSTKSRFSIDIDELERQLRQTASAGPAKSGAQADPLAELARIVGKDDPFKVMFEQPKAKPVAATTPAPAPVVPPVPSHESIPVVHPPLHSPMNDAPEVHAPLPEDSLRGALSEFDSLLREEFGPRPTEPVAVKVDGIPPAESDMLASHIDEIVREQRDTRHGDAYEPDLRADVAMPAIEPDAAASPDLVPLAPRRNRKGALMIGGLLSIAVIGIGGAIAFRPGPKAPGGEPPTIKASTEPTKVQPQNPGGAEVPNQNRTILERQPDAKPADTKVVNREEQPMDVQAAARQAARVVLPSGPSAPAATPSPAPVSAPASTPAAPVQSVPVAAAPATPTATAAPAAAPTSPLGEPRRVRTIAIRPDGSVIGAPPATPTAPSAPAGSPVPSLANAMPPVTAAPAPAPAPRPATPPATPRAEQTTTPAPAPKPAERVAAAPAQPQPQARPQPAPKPAAPAAADTSGTTGGFAVQLGAPGSDAEARSSFAALQRRFPEQLGGRAPVVRKADLPDGRTVYRLRVGPLSREAAASLCESLKSSGGSCFIARN